MGTEPDWPRLGRWVAAERARRGLTTRGLAEQAGVSERTLQRIEAGRPGSYRQVTLSLIEAALGWWPSSVQSVLHGGEPDRSRDPLLERLAALWPSLTARQQRALVAFVEEITP